MTQVMQPRIGDDPRHVPRLGPEPVECSVGQRSASALDGEDPLPGSRFGEPVEQASLRLAEENVSRSRLGVDHRKPVRFDLVSAQAAYLARPAPGQQHRLHRCGLAGSVRFELQGNGAQLRQIVRPEEPLTRRPPGS